MKLFGNHIKANKNDKDMVNEIDKEPILEKAVMPPSEPVDNSGEKYTCKSCGAETPLTEIKRMMYVCPNCGKHDKISARRRIMSVADPGTLRTIYRSEIRWIILIIVRRSQVLNQRQDLMKAYCQVYAR